MTNALKRGDFSLLAKDYAKYRPGYSKDVINAIFGTLKKPSNEIIAADVGAGTGIFSRALFDKGIKSIFAVEPNKQMREEGKKISPVEIKWKEGSAEETGLGSKSIDLISMASSFHWPDTNLALKEFDRILQRSGSFLAIWNPRFTELSEVESEIQSILINKYKIKSRVSSGRSGITENLEHTLRNSDYFSSVIHFQQIELVNVSKEKYMGAWRSVNDIRSQLGESKFMDFIEHTDKLLTGLASVDVYYQTRAWLAMK